MKVTPKIIHIKKLYKFKLYILLSILLSDKKREHHELLQNIIMNDFFLYFGLNRNQTEPIRQELVRFGMIFITFGLGTVCKFSKTKNSVCFGLNLHKSTTVQTEPCSPLAPGSKNFCQDIPAAEGTAGHM